MQPAAHTPTPISAPELVRQDLDPIDWVVPYLVPQGLTLLLGPPRWGKSEVCLALAARQRDGDGAGDTADDPDADDHPEAARSLAEARDRDLTP